MEILIGERQRRPCFAFASKSSEVDQCAGPSPGVLRNGPYHPLLLRWVVWSMNTQPTAKRKMHIWLVNHVQAPVSTLLFVDWPPSVFFKLTYELCDMLIKKPAVAPVNCTRGPPRPCCYACYLICTLYHPGGRSFIFFYLFCLFLSFTFRNWPLVTGVQSGECCGFLEVNIWPRTEGTYRRNKVRDAVFCLHRYFLISLFSCTVPPHPAFLAEISVYLTM